MCAFQATCNASLILQPSVLLISATDDALLSGVVWCTVYPSSLYHIKMKSRQQCWKRSNHLTAEASEILLYLSFIFYFGECRC